MSWQEQLRQLDEELAAGRISADDYRLRRDGVLSAAVNADPQSAQTGNSEAESTQIIAPVTPPGQQPAAAPSAEQTQIVNAAFGDGERTQAVSQAPQGWAPQGDADRTQVVPGVPPQATAGGLHQGGHGSGGFPAQQPPYAPPPGMSGPNQQPWAAPQNPNTPWGGSDFPADTSWVGQGPEPSFEAAPSKGGGKKIIAIVVAVVVLAGLGVGGYFLFSGGSNDKNPPAAQSSTAPPPPTQKPKDDLEIAKLPGEIKETTDFAKFDDFIARKVLTDEENDAVSAANPQKARMSVSNLPSGVTVVVVSVKTSDASAASSAVEKLTNLQAKYKLTKYTGTTPTGVDAMQLVKEDGSALIRAHYVHKQTVVRVQVNGADATGVSQVFDEILAKQLAELPASS